MIDSNPEIDALHHAWRQALQLADLEGLLSLLAPDYVLWAAGVPPIVGHAPLRSQLAAALAAYHVDATFECEERIVSGDLAVERGWEVQTIRPRTGGSPQTQRQRVFLVLQRTSDGAWCFARGMSQPEPRG